MNVDLAIGLTGDSSDVSSAFDKAASSADDYGNAVSSAADKADGASSRIASVGDSADNVDSKAAAATGSLGALSSGFELIGAEGAAAGLQSAAMATDFLSGAGQGLNLILQSQIVQTNLAKAAAIGKGIADRALGAASKVAAAGQWALNAAMSANPIGLVVIAVAALVAGFILAYNKSETFRTIVQGAMNGAKTAIGFVVDKVGDIAEKVQDAAGKFPSIGDAAGKVKTVAVEAFNAITSPIQALIGFIDTVINKLGSIKFPSPPDWLGKIPGLGRVASSGGSGSFTAGAVELFTPAVNVPAARMAGGDSDRAVNVTVNVRMDGFVGTDQDIAGRLAPALSKALGRNGLRLGGAVSS